MGAFPPTGMRHRLSPATYRLLMEFEVGGGRAYYEKTLNRPTWPGGASGVTVGIGYDCGYNTADEIRRVWSEAGLNVEHVKRLAKTAGWKGRRAQEALRNDPLLRAVIVPWEIAAAVFNEETVPRFIRTALRVFPGAEARLADGSLTADAFGALVSVVLNRGEDMEGDRRREMRAIRDALMVRRPAAELSNVIAGQLQAMVRIWRGTDIEKGMRRRREAEAELALGLYQG